MGELIFLALVVIGISVVGGILGIIAFARTSRHRRLLEELDRKLSWVQGGPATPSAVPPPLVPG